MRAYPRPSKLSRRGVLAGLLTPGAAPILQACAAATPTRAPPKPTEPPKPAAPAAAPSNTAAPAKPAEAPKPTEAPKAAEATKPGPEGTPAPKPAAAAPGAAQPKTVKVVDWVAETI